MKRTLPALRLLLMFVAAIALTAPAKTTHSRKSAPKVEPHFSLMADAFTLDGAIDHIGLADTRGVKSVKFVKPLGGDDDFDFADVTRYEFDRHGRLVAMSYKYGDAGGGGDFTVGYDSQGRPAKVVRNQMELTQDACTDFDKLWYSAIYVIDYADGRPKLITETTTKVGRRTANTTYHYTVSPGPDGGLDIRCKEQPDIFVSFDRDFNLRKYRRYVYGCNGNGQPVFYIENGEIPPIDTSTTDDDQSADEPQRARTTVDSHGNWTKKEWDYDGHTLSEYRIITYF